ncbi:MAG: hypothetical protein AAGJ74_04340 [Pseudomonadota bacterium]
MADACTYRYVLYGLELVADMAFPELAAAGPSSLGKLEVRHGAVPDTLGPGTEMMPGLHMAGRQCLFTFDGPVAFLVEDGERITVAPRQGAVLSDVRLFVLGSAIAVALHQRGDLPLHVSGVVGPGGVVAFTGPSGAGKSTMATELHRQTGWPLFCDDVAVLRLEAGRPMLYGGVRRVKLWRDAALRFGLDPSEMARDYSRADKFHAGLDAAFAQPRQAMTHLFQLEQGTQVQQRRVSGREKLEVLSGAVYRPQFFRAYAEGRDVFALLAGVAAGLEIGLLSRPLDEGGLNASVQAVTELVSGVPV